MNMRIKYLKDVPPIEIIKGGDWIDLCTSEDVALSRMESKAIPLGVAIELPKGYEALVVPRSSTYKRYGVIQTNSVGVIDEAYNGDNDEWHFPVLCMREHTFIPKGARICQFRLIKHQEPVRFNVVEFFGNTDRGGFGSTGL